MIFVLLSFYNYMTEIEGAMYEKLQQEVQSLSYTIALREFEKRKQRILESLKVAHLPLWQQLQ